MDYSYSVSISKNLVAIARRFSYITGLLAINENMILS